MASRSGCSLIEGALLNADDQVLHGSYHEWKGQLCDIISIECHHKPLAHPLLKHCPAQPSAAMAACGRLETEPEESSPLTQLHPNPQLDPSPFVGQLRAEQPQLEQELQELGLAPELEQLNPLPTSPCAEQTGDVVSSVDGMMESSADGVMDLFSDIVEPGHDNEAPAAPQQPSRADKARADKERRKASRRKGRKPESDKDQVVEIQTDKLELLHPALEFQLLQESVMELSKTFENIWGSIPTGFVAGPGRLLTQLTSEMATAALSTGNLVTIADGNTSDGMKGFYFGGAGQTPVLIEMVASGECLQLTIKSTDPQIYPAANATVQALMQQFLA
eukprot:TRINITY_DN2681_c0_g1_i3.p1 TRINITY_DN2681_c0_g1~~TRINITY_DN2681_c0_g1_i3.p1  ORF type:complete len:334 (-),score=48.34 TRINITY_DN2681_c0_g1_i3:414-1415(-)